MTPLFFDPKNDPFLGPKKPDLENRELFGGGHFWTPQPQARAVNRAILPKNDPFWIGSQRVLGGKWSKKGSKKGPRKSQRHEI